MAFNLLLLHSDGSTGINFAQSLQHAKQRGWGSDVNIIGLSHHPVRMQLCKNDRTYFVTEEEARDTQKLVTDIQHKIGGSIDLVYETKSAPYMLKISSERSLFPVFLPPHNLVKIFEDKFQTYLHLQKHGFPVPKTYLITSPDDLAKAFKKFAPEAVWVRAVRGQGGKGSFSTSSLTEAHNEIEAKNGWGSYTVSEQMSLAGTINWKERLSSDTFPGEMMSWVALYNKGVLVGGQVRKRLYWEHTELTTSGVTGYSGANMTLSRKDIHELSDSIIRSFDWVPDGAVGIDYLGDANGEVKVTEVQASRFFTSTYPLALLGLNLPSMYVDVFRGFPVETKAVNPCPEGFVYIQRFGAESMMVHRDKILSNL